MPSELVPMERTGNVTGSFTSLTKLITGSSYLAGIGFSAASILKFKSHKDNPTQIPVGTSAALIATSAALTYLPSIKSTGLTTSDVKSTAQSAGVTTEKVESAAESAGATSPQVSAAESELKDKLAG